MWKYSVLGGIVSAIAAAALVGPVLATADVYEGVREFPAPQRPRSLTAEAPIEQQSAHLRLYGARYDSQTGSLTIFFGYYEPEYWAPRIASTTAAGLTGSFPGLPYELFALVPQSGAELSGKVPVAISVPTSEGEGSILGGEVRLEGVRGSVTAPTTYEGRLYNTTFTNPAFANAASAWYLVPSWAAAFRETAPAQPLPLVDITHPPVKPPQPKSSSVVARRATKSQAAALNAAFHRYERVGRHRKALGRLDLLRDVRVTNNGWADAYLAARHPQRGEQPGNRMIFHLAGRWRVVSWGTAPDVRSVPRSVLKALEA